MSGLKDLLGLRIKDAEQTSSDMERALSGTTPEVFNTTAVRDRQRQERVDDASGVVRLFNVISGNLFYSGGAPVLPQNEGP